MVEIERRSDGGGSSTHTGGSLGRVVFEIIGNGGGVFALESRVPVILDGVISATIEKTSNGGPLVAESGVSLDNGVIFIGSERVMLHLRRKLVAPPESARLARSPRDGLTYKRPIPGAVAVDEAAQQLVLFGTPRTFYPVDGLSTTGGSHKGKVGGGGGR